MFRRIAGILLTVSFAFGILFTSFLRTVRINYAFSSSPSPTPSQANTQEEIKVDYLLPYPGRILPDNPLWYLKVVRDKIWFLVTTNSGKQAELKLLFADKRLASSKVLFEKGKNELGFSTLTKAEKYLEEAVNIEIRNREKGMDTFEFLNKLANSSLKHREVIETILQMAPEDAKPEVIKTEDYAINAYKSARDALLSKGLPVPKSPFDGD
jgi:hypothetical protein